MNEEDKINIKDILKWESKIMNPHSLLNFEILYILFIKLVTLIKFSKNLEFFKKLINNLLFILELITRKILKFIIFKIIVLLHNLYQRLRYFQRFLKVKLLIL